MTDVIEEQRRAAHNQSLFREVNERVEQVTSGRQHRDVPYAEWVCECADETCTERLLMTIAEYEALRRHPNRFAVLPDEAHVFTHVENIVEKTDRYWVVTKTGAAEPVAIALDPRMQGF